MSGRKICLWICMECSFKFPRNFSFKNCGGIEPIGSHIRYLPDFCFWNGSVVLATDEASIQGNPLVGQAQSNLWFGDFEELREWGPRSAAGSIYMNDQVKAGQPSAPFLINGFPKRMIHLASDRPVTFTLEIDREGKGIFETYRSIKVERFASHIFPGIWMLNGFGFKRIKPALHPYPSISRTMNSAIHHQEKTCFAPLLNMTMETSVLHYFSLMPIIGICPCSPPMERHMTSIT